MRNVALQDPTRFVEWPHLQSSPKKNKHQPSQKRPTPSPSVYHGDLLQDDGSLSLVFGFPQQPTYRRPVCKDPMAISRILPGGYSVGRNYGSDIVNGQSLWPTREANPQYNQLGVPQRGTFNELPHGFFD